LGAQGWPGLHKDLRASLGGAMLFINNGRVMGNLILSGLLDRYRAAAIMPAPDGFIPSTQQLTLPLNLDTGDMQRQIVTHLGR